MVFMKDFFEAVNYEIKQQMAKMHAKFPSLRGVKYSNQAPALSSACRIVLYMTSKFY